MTTSTFTKHSTQPLTYQININEYLGATFQYINHDLTQDESKNSAEITLLLEKTSVHETPFNHSFLQVMDELDGKKDIKFTITISTSDHNVKIITHQESGTNIERPILKAK